MSARHPSTNTGTGELASGAGDAIEKSTALDRFVAGLIARHLAKAPVRLVLWDGSEFATAEPRAKATVAIASRTALLRLLLHPQLYFGECYAEGSIDIDGNLPDTMTAL